MHWLGEKIALPIATTDPFNEFPFQVVFNTLGDNRQQFASCRAATWRYLFFYSLLNAAGFDQSLNDHS